MPPVLKPALVVLALVTVFVPLTPADAAGQVPRCHGKKATIYPGSPGTELTKDDSRDFDYMLVGTPGNDVIVGTPDGGDEIRAGGGRDTICSLGGNDWIEAGAGRDWVDAGVGDDTVYGNAGKDYCNGGPGRDGFFSCEKRHR
jgi:Ca2+-binding RTX toxin-like protein